MLMFICFLFLLFFFGVELEVGKNIEEHVDVEGEGAVAEVDNKCVIGAVK